MRSFKPANMVTEFTLSSLKFNKWQVEWEGQTNGTMVLTLEGDQLHRSRDYFGEGNHSSRISMIDEDTILLHTHYGGTIYREEIRLLNSDTVRLRQTFGKCDTTGKPKLIGQYYELRV